jgi:hypothetical protein
MSALLDRATVNLTAAQKMNARIIEEEFAKAGYDEKVILAAIANAYAESYLDATAAGDGGKSIGLFQLASFGAGAGMSVGERMNPYVNTRRIIEEVRRYGKRTLAASTPREAAAYFSMDVERPADVQGAAQRRREIVDKLFPDKSRKVYAAAGGIIGILAVAGALAAGYFFSRGRKTR